MADETVTIRNARGEEKEVGEAAVPFFVNQGFEVLTADGKRNTKATEAAKGDTPSS